MFVLSRSIFAISLICILTLSSQVYAAPSLNEGHRYRESGDYEKALTIYQVYAKEGSVEAFYNLAVMYQEGVGVDVDYDRAAYFYVKAADLGHAMSMNNLGRLYYREGGLPDNYEKAKYWFEKSSELGDINAKFNLAFMIMKGDAHTVDYSKSRNLLLSIEGKYKGIARYYLGAMYERGLGIEVDAQKAVLWYKKSADIGFHKGISALKRLESTGSDWTSPSLTDTPKRGQ